MPVITINGPIGCGAVTIGQMVSEQMNLNFLTGFSLPKQPVSSARRLVP